MVKDYKGEMPNNVTTPEKAKAQKPFYKNWKFWVLTGLMTLFGACSVYGLVLGSQYVKAIERASHIIADAQSGNVGDSQLQKPRHNLATPAGGADHFDFENHFRGGWSGDAFFRIDTGANVVSNQLPVYIPCWRITIATDQTRANLVFPLSSSGYTTISPTDYIKDYRTNASMSWWTPTLNYVISPQQPLHFYGTFYYYPATQFYDDGYSAGQSDGYSDGYAEGSADGYEDGYQEGYSDGSDAINVNQSVKVLLPAGDENSCSFTTYLDGVPDQQGILSSSSSFGAYGEFNRNRNQKLRIDLTLPSGFRAFFMYVPHWTSAYPSDENYSLRQSWAVSGVTYLPTWVAKPEIYVGITSALVDDLTYDTISVAFDVDHWGDVRVGAYQQGYQDGYSDGQQDPTAYQSGYDAGFSDGHAQGETEGFNRGVAVGSRGSQSLAMMFKTAFQLPFDQLYRFLNFNLLGINFLSLFTALISVSIGIMVIKKVL